MPSETWVWYTRPWRFVSGREISSPKGRTECTEPLQIYALDVSVQECIETARCSRALVLTCLMIALIGGLGSSLQGWRPSSRVGLPRGV